MRQAFRLPRARSCVSLSHEPQRRPTTHAPAGCGALGEDTMSTTTADALAARQRRLGQDPVEVGPLEQEHLKNPNYRAVATSGEKLTPTHWHIATANGL